MNNIVLLGFMASGKTTVGKELARYLGYQFVDTDTAVEQREERAIAEIFSAEGENYFRDREHEIMRELLQGEFQVVATGGGIISRPENVAVLQGCKDFTVWLDISPEEVIKRTQGDETRPLLKTEDEKEKRNRIENLLKIRYPLYDAATQIRISVDDKTSEEIIAEILQHYGEKK